MGNTQEMLQILTRDGKPTGGLEPRDVVHEKGLIHAEVALFIYNDKGQLLLQRRSKNKKANPNKLAIVAGHVSDFDTPIDTVVRECQEEIGLRTFKSKFTQIHVEYREKENKEQNNRIFSYVYAYKCNWPVNKFVVQTEELSEVMWVDFDVVKQKMLECDPEYVFARSPYYEKVFNLLEKVVKGK